MTSNLQKSFEHALCSGNQINSMNSATDKHGRPVVLTLLTDARFLIQFSTRADFAPEQAALLGHSLPFHPLQASRGRSFVFILFVCIIYFFGRWSYQKGSVLWNGMNV